VTAQACYDATEHQHRKNILYKGLQSHASLSREKYIVTVKQHTLCENLCRMTFCWCEFIGVSQVGQSAFLQFTSEICSCTDGAASGGESIRPGSIDKVRDAFSAMFLRYGFKK